jgi:hypothetical protein
MDQNWMIHYKGNKISVWLSGHLVRKNAPPIPEKDTDWKILYRHTAHHRYSVGPGTHILVWK